MPTSQRPSSAIRFGPFKLDAAAAELHKNGTLIKLQPQPLKVLFLLIQHAGQVVTREEIQRCLWSDSTFVDFERGINFSINQIRSALADNADRPRYIETLPRRGYRFIAEVAHHNSTKDAPAVLVPIAANDEGVAGGNGASASSASESFVQALPIVTATAGWRGRRLILAAMATGIVFLGFSAWIMDRATFRRLGINFESLQLNKLTDSGKAEEGVAISPDGRYVVYERREAKGLGLWVRQVATHSNVEILPPGDFEFDGITFSPDGNYIYFVRSDEKDHGFKYLYTMPTLGGPPRLLINDIDSPVSFSPDGREFVFTRGIPTQNAVEVRIANANGSGDRLLVSLSDTSAGFQPGATWSPDRRSIAVSRMLNGKRSGFVLDSLSVADGSLREVYSSAYTIGRPLWLPEGDTLLVPLGDRSDRKNQLWTISYPGGEKRRLTNDLASYDFRIDLARDAKTVAAMERTITSNVWLAPTEDPTKARQLTVSELPIVEILALPQGKILVRSEDGDLWTMNDDGTQRASFADLHNTSTPGICGRSVVFNSFQAGLAEMMRVDIDGRNATKLTSGHLFSPVCSPDGKFVYYVRLGQPQKILRIPIEGGDAVEIAMVEGDGIVGSLAISPDGEFLAYPFEVYQPEAVTKMAVLPIVGGARKRAFEVPGGIRGRAPRWSPARNDLQFLLTENGATNIWEQPLDGGVRKQLTRFTSGLIFDFSWSLDGKQLFLAKGDSSSSVILLTNSADPVH
jgi:DNA-binding winged helix-turn-helix (wHTH) protein/Tol biopolymer transport system component